MNPYPTQPSTNRDWRTLRRSDGTSFKDFRQHLEPRIWQVWLELGLGLLALLAPAASALVVPWREMHPVWGILGAIAGAVWVGYWLAYVVLFLHEATHYNIAKERALNDWLANVLIGSWVFQNVKAYRKIHFEHHRRLGTTGDTERSYFLALTPRFLLESLFGIRVLKVLAFRHGKLEEQQRELEPATRPSRWPLFLGLFLHLALLVGPWLHSHAWPMVLAWVFGVALIYPFFGSVRQVLEHRSASADPAIDYSRTDHGEVNRLFGNGPFASTFGGAGFNRHYLHHLEPQISYTRLKELEHFLDDTEFSGELSARRTTYFKTFRELLVRPQRPSLSHGSASAVDRAS